MNLTKSNLIRYIDLLSSNQVEVVLKEFKQMLKDNYSNGKRKRNFIELPSDEIKRLYLEGKSTYELADMFYVSCHTIRNRLQEMGVKLRHFNLGNLRVHITPEELRRLYWDEFKTSEEIGRMYGCTSVNILHIMRKYGIPIRDPHYKGKIYKKV